jgi:hypothetical protein
MWSHSSKRWATQISRKIEASWLMEKQDMIARSKALRITHLFMFDHLELL